MSRKGVANLPASVHQRLLNLSSEKGEAFNLILTRYAVERLLFRLSKSSHSDQFVLKGAMLFAVWTAQPHRPTRDLDLLGYGEASQERLASVFRDVCQTSVEPDGLQFDWKSIQVEDIRENDEYQGQRVKLRAHLGKARIPVQIDIGFGDVVTPDPKEIVYRTLLDESPAPRIRAYPRETVIAEKLQAMVALGMANSRMKDFYDLQMMAREFSFDGSTLANAIRATFDRRRTEIQSTTPIALSDEFAKNSDKTDQWTAFLNRDRLDGAGVDFPNVIGTLRSFLTPPLFAAFNAEPFRQTWPPGGPWKG